MGYGRIFFTFLPIFLLSAQIPYIYHQHLMGMEITMQNMYSD